MSLSGLAFLFDIIVEDLKSFVPTKRFVIKSQFADIFSLVLKNPDLNERKRKRKKLSKNKLKAKNTKNEAGTGTENKISNGQTLLFVGNIDTLMSHMMQYPMEICLCSEYDREQRIGSTVIPWNPTFIEYMMSLYHESNPAPAVVKSVHTVFHEETSKRMATIRLNIKLHITDHINLHNFRILSNKHPNTFIMMDVDQLIDHSTNTKEFTESHGTIKTIYSEGKKKKRSSINKRNAEREANIARLAKGRDQRLTIARVSNIPKSTLLHFIRSDTAIARPFQPDLLSSKSCSNVKEIKLFDYIFGDRSGPFGNKTYTVGYMTVDNSKSKSPSGTSTSPPATKSPEKTTSKSSVSMNREHELSTIVKCDTVSCLYKKEKPLLEKPDDRILLDITSVKHSCFITDTIERKMEVIGEKPGEEMLDPCYCACECTFGFERKTTYCRICKGYERRGDDLDGIPQYKMPDPCPVYHKISRIKTGSTSGSDSKKESKKKSKSPEPEKDKKKNKNDRFKFNYGYKGIPPQIGHSRCALPCTGTMSNVPKHMGWLWTADNVPGLVVAGGWKPGAVSKYILRKLKQAKLRSRVVEDSAPEKKSKRKCGDKPTLVIKKKEGEYTVEMQVTSENAQNCVVYDPLVYKIASASNEKRIKRRERKTKKLIKDMIKEFDDPFHPEVCQQTCAQTYKELFGGFDVPEYEGDGRSLKSCSCEEPQDMDQDSDGSSSLDLDWEVQFSPPNSRVKS